MFHLTDSQFSRIGFPTVNASFLTILCATEEGEELGTHFMPYYYMEQETTTEQSVAIVGRDCMY